MESDQEIVLNQLQQKAYQIILDKKSIFITGAGGTGKSVLIKKIKKDMEKKNIAMTSTTGVSAKLINGVTLHSYLGIQLGDKSYDDLLKLIKINKTVFNRWKLLDILIIDEISMLSVELFEKLDKLAQTLRNNKLPFGGIQLILTGDFCQLPSINSTSLLFESKIWNQCIKETIYLTEIIRQTDINFVKVLNKVRLGIVDEEVQTILKSREIKYKASTGLIPTMLYSINAKVDKTNKLYYERLESQEYTYNVSYHWHKKISFAEKYDSLIRFKTQLKLKVGTQVMFLINRYGLVNGSRGIITSFIEGFPMVLFSDGNEKNNVEMLIRKETLNIEENNKLIMSYTQLPITLAFATSIHKCQGSTVSLARIDFKNIFEYGQAYTSISRVKSLEGLYIRNLDFSLIKAHPKAVEYYNRLQSNI